MEDQSTQGGTQASRPQLALLSNVQSEPGSEPSGPPQAPVSATPFSDVSPSVGKRPSVCASLPVVSAGEPSSCLPFNTQMAKKKKKKK